MTAATNGVSSSVGAPHPSIRRANTLPAWARLSLLNRTQPAHTKWKTASTRSHRAQRRPRTRRTPLRTAGVTVLAGAPAGGPRLLGQPLGDQAGAVVEAPHDEHPGRAVPQPAQAHGHQQVDVGARPARRLPPKGM